MKCKNGTDAHNLSAKFIKVPPLLPPVFSKLYAVWVGGRGGRWGQNHLTLPQRLSEPTSAAGHLIPVKMYS